VGYKQDRSAGGHGGEQQQVLRWGSASRQPYAANASHFRRFRNFEKVVNVQMIVAILATVGAISPSLGKNLFEWMKRCALPT
jgi:hypothetical protein